MFTDDPTILCDNFMLKYNHKAARAIESYKERVTINSYNTVIIYTEQIMSPFFFNELIKSLMFLVQINFSLSNLILLIFILNPAKLGSISGLHNFAKTASTFKSKR